MVFYKQGDFKDWQSAEAMSSIPHYHQGIIVNYNMSRQSGKGSAIFIHEINPSPNYQYTLGCTAMDKEALEKVMAWLQYDKNPILVQMPKENLSLKSTNSPHRLNHDFVYLEDYIPNITIDAKYAKEDNFTGEKVKGYLSQTVIVKKVVAEALSQAQKELNQLGFSILAFDGYRPTQAVSNFVDWVRSPETMKTKSQYYPDLTKEQLLTKGYIAESSTHSSGFAIDLSLIDLKTGKEVDMGSPFDYFGTQSHYQVEGLDLVYQERRTLLRDVLMKYGFSPYDKEWWHFSHEDYKPASPKYDFQVIR